MFIVPPCLECTRFISDRRAFSYPMGGLCAGGFSSESSVEHWTGERPGEARTRARKEKQEGEFSAKHSTRMGAFVPDEPLPRKAAAAAADIERENEELRSRLERSETGLRYTLDYIDTLKYEISAAGLDIGKFETNIKARLEGKQSTTPDQNVQECDQQPLLEAV